MNLHTAVSGAFDGAPDVAVVARYSVVPQVCRVARRGRRLTAATEASPGQRG